VDLNATISRLAGHAALLGMVVLAVVLARTLPDETARLPQATPAFDARNVIAAVGGPYREDHTAHIAVLSSFQTANITRLADPHTEMPLRPRTDILTYTVQPGDTPISIAAQFNLHPETILWGNPALNAEADSLRIGLVLNILPVDGVLHIVAEGDTLEKLLEAHGTPVVDIVAFPGNNLPRGGPYTLTPGQAIIIPNGTAEIVWKEPGPLIVTGQGRPSASFYTGSLTGSGAGKFIWPVSPIVITQGFWAGHRAIDLDTYRGQPILAADSGTVIYSGWDNTGYGFLVILDHGNGYWTYYAHNSELLVQAGESVVQGQTIALSGSTGNSTGDHLDFRIRQGNVFLNPLEFLP